MSVVAHLSIVNLYKDLKKSSNEETALIISKAFEQLIEDQQNQVKHQIVEGKKAILDEMTLKDPASKKDLLELNLQLKKEIAVAKWQVIGSVAVMLFIEIALKHFGV